MDSSNATAADAALARAVACRTRLTRLAQGQHVGTEDVRAAHDALVRAQLRADRARRRLIAVRLRQLGGGRPPTTGAFSPIPSGIPDLAALRAATRDLAARGLYVAYFSLGGNCTPLELDAFAHAALELPTDELTLLAHAVWELTEL